MSYKIHSVKHLIGKLSTNIGGTFLTCTECVQDNDEIEAVEACDWLRAAGFPQYAQMYEESHFPLDVTSVEKDHEFLDRDSLQSLFRRLNILNKCASMKIETPTRKSNEESDEDEQCALSDKWRFQRTSRRWSRCDLDLTLDLSAPCSPIESGSLRGDGHVSSVGMRSFSSHDSLLTDNESPSPQDDSPVLQSKSSHREVELFIPDSPVEESFHTPQAEFLPKTNIEDGMPGYSPASPRFQRSASERLKGAKSFLKRMESLTSSKKKKVPTATLR